MRRVSSNEVKFSSCTAKECYEACLLCKDWRAKTNRLHTTVNIGVSNLRSAREGSLPAVHKYTRFDVPRNIIQLSCNDKLNIVSAHALTHTKGERPQTNASSMKKSEGQST